MTPMPKRRFSQHVLSSNLDFVTSWSWYKNQPGPVLLPTKLATLRRAFPALLQRPFYTTRPILLPFQHRKMSSETSEVKQAKEVEEETLPPLTPFELTKYNALAKKMQYFHSYLLGEYEQAYELADGTYTKRGMSLKTFLNSVDEFRMRESHQEENYSNTQFFCRSNNAS